jgi:hypothetical protein
MARITLAILLGFLSLGLGTPLGAAPIGFQGNPIQFPYATAPRGIGFQGQFYNPNRFVVDPAVAGPGFQPTRGTFPIDQDPQFPVLDPRFDPTPTQPTPQRGF